jgi:hypothetical protein
MEEQHIKELWNDNDSALVRPFYNKVWHDLSLGVQVRNIYAEKSFIEYYTFARESVEQTTIEFQRTIKHVNNRRALNICNLYEHIISSLVEKRVLRMRMRFALDGAIKEDYPKGHEGFDADFKKILAYMLKKYVKDCCDKVRIEIKNRPNPLLDRPIVRAGKYILAVLVGGLITIGFQLIFR